MPFLGPVAGGFLYDGSGLVGALHPALILDKMIRLMHGYGYGIWSVGISSARHDLHTSGKIMILVAKLEKDKSD